MPRPGLNDRVQVDALPQRGVSPAPQTNYSPVYDKGFRGRDTGFHQVAAALADINPALQRLGYGYIKSQGEEDQARGTDYALANPDKVRQASQMEFRKAVDAGLIPAAASPWFRAGAFAASGEVQAREGYVSQLNARRDEIVNPDNPVDPHAILNEERSKFYETVGDNFYTRQAADKAIPAIEAGFMSHAMQERDKNLETKAIDDNSRVALSELSAFDSLGNDQVKSQFQSKIKEIADTWRIRNIPDANTTLFSKAMAPFAVNFAQIDPTKAREFIDAMQEAPITADGAKFGSSGRMVEAFSKLRDTVDKIEIQSQNMDKKNFETRRTKTINDGIDFSQSLIEDHLKNGGVLDDSFIDDVAKNQLPKQFSGEPGFVGTLQNNFKEIANSYQRFGEPKTTDGARQSIQSLMDAGKYDDAINLVNTFQLHGGVSYGDGKQMVADARKAMQLQPLLADPVIKTFNSVLSHESASVLKASFGDNVPPEALFLHSQITNDFHQSVLRGLQELQKSNPNVTTDMLESQISPIAQKAYGDFDKKYRDKIKEIQTRTEFENKRQLEVEKDANKAPIDVNKKWFPSEFDKLSVRQDRITQVLAHPDRLDDASQREVMGLQVYIDNHAKSVMSTLANQLATNKTNGWFGDRAMDDKDRHAAFDQYMTVKRSVGFNPQEIIAGTTQKDGIKFDPLTINPYTTMVFSNKTELEAYYNNGQPNPLADALFKRLGVSDTNEFFKRQNVLLRQRGRF